VGLGWPGRKRKVHRVGHIERCLVLVACWIVLLAVSAHAQGNATLLFSLDAQPSISLVFKSYPGACSLSNAGTNNVGLYLGWATQPSQGQHGGCGQYTVINGNTYQMSSAFYLEVDISNSASTQYDLRAWVSSPIPGKVSNWLSGTQLGTARPSAPLQTNAYGSSVQTFATQIGKQVAAGMETVTVQFEATAR
jgi:hypothetical protein